MMKLANLWERANAHIKNLQAIKNQHTTSAQRAFQDGDWASADYYQAKADAIDKRITRWRTQ